MFWFRELFFVIWLFRILHIVFHLLSLRIWVADVSINGDALILYTKGE
jgi:hypothetical protein